MSEQQNDELRDLTAEAVLGIAIAMTRGKNPPRWLCMSDESKAEYIATGAAAVEAFRADEIASKKAREEGNPRGFFCA